MQLERLVTRTRRRLAGGTFAGLLRSARAHVQAHAHAGPAAVADAGAARPRGSGSWANDWSEPASAMERAMSLALPDRRRPGAPPPEPAAPEPAAPVSATPISAERDRAESHPAEPEAGGVRTKPLMSLREVRLHNWLADRLEAAAPTCSLHARVSASAFLTSDPTRGVAGPLHDLVADMLIADQNGQPVAALVRGTAGGQPRRQDLLRVLREADLPFVDLSAHPGLADLWAEIARVLPKD